MEEKDLEKKIDNANKKVEQLLAIMEKQQEMIMNNAAKIKQQESLIAKNIRDLENLAQNIRYELGDTKKFENNYWYPKIMDQHLTMKQLIEQRKSYLRFTQTTLDMLLHHDDQDEEDQDEEAAVTKLREKLISILKSENENYIIALPDYFGALDYYKKSSRMKFRDFLTEERRQKLMKLLPQHKNYHDANMMHPDEYDELRSMTLVLERYRMLTPLWNGRKIVAVTAPNNGLNSDNPYFKTGSSMVTIDVPVVDAYDHYEEIYNKCIAEQDYSAIYLIAAGPLGVCLGADLCKAGLQAIDIGTLGKRYLEYQNKIGGTQNVSS